MTGNDFLVILFESVSSTLLAEKILKKQNVAHKIIPVPRHISSDCGVCIRFSAAQLDEVEQALSGRVPYQDIRKL
ncbi:MAG TPA: DUF3343 domain-containing protein [Deltaproteobacteria bacterium]|nr:DUF3343 domain-containing protein [Deltaproteobacteria bacterium]